MVNYTPVEISTNLKDELQQMATDKNTDIDNIIKLALVENQQLRKKPDNYIDTTKVSSKKNKGNSYSFSTAIPKPILNKLGLTKGQILYWDIDEYKIIITPEVKAVPTPELESIEAGIDILTDILENKNHVYYTGAYGFILGVLNGNDSKDDKLKIILNDYKELKNTENSNLYQAGFKKVVLYLLDKPLDISQHELLKEVYEEINK